MLRVLAQLPQRQGALLVRLGSVVGWTSRGACGIRTLRSTLGRALCLPACLPFPPSLPPPTHHAGTTFGWSLCGRRAAR